MYIAFDFLVKEMKQQEKINVKETVLKMREKRKDMVQTLVSCVEMCRSPRTTAN